MFRKSLILLLLIGNSFMQSNQKTESKKVPRIGVGVIIVKDNKILMGKRKNSHGEGTWSLPGGHLEFGETPQECAIRETKEETDLDIENVQAGPYTNDVFENEGKHYITLFMIAKHKTGQPKNMEPDKCESWQWFDIDKLPDNLFLPLKNLIKLHKLEDLFACCNFIFINQIK
jgi:8-oxo-dGTP diphosphatase